LTCAKERAVRSLDETELKQGVAPTLELYQNKTTTEDGSSIPQEQSISQSVSQGLDVSSHMFASETRPQGEEAKKILSMEILIEDIPASVTSSKFANGRFVGVKERGSSKVRPVKGSRLKKESKTIKVPPPMINPYNTMSNLQVHAHKHRKDVSVKSNSQPQSKLSMTSTSKLIKSTNSQLNGAERAKSSIRSVQDQGQLSASNSN